MLQTEPMYITIWHCPQNNTTMQEFKNKPCASQTVVGLLYLVNIFIFRLQITGRSYSIRKTNSTSSICPPAVKNTRMLKLNSVKLLWIKLSASKEYKIEKFISCIMWSAYQWCTNMAAILLEKNWCCFMAPHVSLLR